MCHDSQTVIETSLAKRCRETIRKVQVGNWLQNVQHSAFFGFALWLRLQISIQSGQLTELPHHVQDVRLLQNNCCNVS